LLIALLLHMPLWLTIPAYFLIGIAWAVLYLPRSITLQARKYRAWRDSVTHGRPLADYLGPAGKLGKSVHPETFLESRDRKGFTERRILVGFMLNIAFWPLRVVQKVLCDLLRSTFIWIIDLLGDVWTKLIVPTFRALGRILRAVGRWLRAVVDRLANMLEVLWDLLVVSVWRAIRRFARFIWCDILVPMYTWTYRYITTVYKSIIQRANREAIADLAALNKTTTEDSAK